MTSQFFLTWFCDFIIRKSVCKFVLLTREFQIPSFLTKIIHLRKDRFEKSAGVLSLNFDFTEIKVCNTEILLMNLITFLRLLQELKIPKSCFWTKMTHLSRRSSEKWLWWLCSEIFLSVTEMYVVQDRKCFCIHLLSLKNSKMLLFKQNNTFKWTQFWKVGVVSSETCAL